MQFIRPSNDRLNNSHTKLLLRGDTIADASPNARTITNTGSVTSVAAPGKHPYAKSAGYFNGSSYLRTPNSSDFNISTSDTKTLRMWVYVPSVTAAGGRILIGNTAPDASVAGWILYLGATGSLAFYGASGGSGWNLASVTTGSNLVSLGWNHIVVTFNSGTCSIYVNGEVKGTGPYSSISSSASLSVCCGSSTTYFFTGYVSDLEFSSAIRDINATSAPIIADSYTKLHLPMMEYTGQQVVKETVQNKIPTIGSTLALAQHLPSTGGPAVDRVLSYSGASTSGVTLPTSSDWNFESVDFTLEGWFYFSGSSSTAYNMLSYRDPNGFGPFSLTKNESNQIVFRASSDGGSWDICYISFSSPTSNTFMHIAVTRSGSVFRFYVNGVYVSSATSTKSFYSNSNKLGIGCDSDGTGYVWNGRIGWIHVVKGTALYTTETSFTPPTSPQQCANTKAIILPGDSPTLFMDKSSATAPKAITVTGAQQTLLPGGGKALQNTGSQFLSCADSPDWDFGGADFTIDLLFNRSSGVWVIGQGSVDNADCTISFDVNNGVPRAGFYVGSSFYSISGSTISNGVTYHAAIVRSGDTLYMFINGVLQGTLSLTGKTVNTSSTVLSVFRIGTYANYFLGTLQNVRITKGAALWTKNFIPPAISL